MNEAILVSNGLLWLIVVVLGCVVAALARQIGLLHERIAPVGALMHAQGPQVGEPAPELEVTDLDGQPVRVGGAGPRTLLFFLSPTCPVCDSLLPTLRKVVRDEANEVRLLLASDGGTLASHRAFVESHGLEGIPYLVSTDLGLAYQVAKLPTAVLIDGQGTLRSRGLVNSREHLESLFVADDTGVATIQDHMAERSLAGSSDESGRVEDEPGRVISLHEMPRRQEKVE